ncbi:protein notum [Ochromonadaceae sp. CCMP2298]|nr:protein notum [Ochromonadaceae sp. CCMP2298]
MLRRKLQNTAARCLDGSPPAYYLRKGSVDKWAVFFEGGGWCYDLEQCYERSKGDLGSSLKYPYILDTSRIGHFKECLSPFPKENRMHNWNTVYVRYCDGASFAGNAEQAYSTYDNGTYLNSTLYFKGRTNRDETVRGLLREGMKTASEVVFMGGSAGALGVILGIDAMAHIGGNATVRGLADSGFFLKYTPKQPNNSTGGLKSEESGGYRGPDYQHSMIGLPLSNCFFAEHVLLGVETPIFLTQPQYDLWQLRNVLGKTEDPEESVNEFGALMVRDLGRTLFQGHGQGGHGVFIDSCVHHSASCTRAGENSWQGTHILSDDSLLTPSAAFERWYDSLRPTPTSPTTPTTPTPAPIKPNTVGFYNATAGVNWFFQDRRFPCADCCLCVPMLSQYAIED